MVVTVITYQYITTQVAEEKDESDDNNFAVLGQFINFHILVVYMFFLLIFKTSIWFYSRSLPTP